MDLLLVTGAVVAGAVAGGALDPFGQRLADRSRAEDEQRRAAEEAPDPHASLPPLRALVRPGPSPARTTAAAMLTGALWAAAAARFGADLVLAPFCVLFALLVAVSMTDLSHHLVPRKLVYPALAAIAVLLVAAAAAGQPGQGAHWHHLVTAAIAGAAAFAFFAAIWWWVPQGMGFGDVRLAGVIGVTVGYLGLVDAYLAFLAGFVAGAVFGLATVVVLSSGRRTPIPFAPALALGAVVVVLARGHVG